MSAASLVTEWAQFFVLYRYDNILNNVKDQTYHEEVTSNEMQIARAHYSSPTAANIYHHKWTSDHYNIVTIILNSQRVQASKHGKYTSQERATSSACGVFFIDATTYYYISF